MLDPTAETAYTCGLITHIAPPGALVCGFSLPHVRLQGQTRSDSPCLSSLPRFRGYALGHLHVDDQSHTCREGHGPPWASWAPTLQNILPSVPWCFHLLAELSLRLELAEQVEQEGFVFFGVDGICIQICEFKDCLSKAILCHRT